MYDRSLADLLAELDAELARRNDAAGAARDVLECVEARVPGVILQAAASIDLRRIGFGATT